MPEIMTRQDQGPQGGRVTAILGPTNTGKTHYAIERMAAHATGVIGLPLRLLAREVYQRMCERVGSSAVALVTGEEKIQPPKARFTVCTVEAMPSTTHAAFVALDEVQIAGDLERGHVFTDRILNLRGREETLLLGSGTMEPILRKMVPGIEIITRPRLSQLHYAGSKKITRLPRRTAIVAFSADEVYAIAELVRRQRGGAAVVMGALSPRTRNAQVELYQNGDVEYLVATDAIGMGLNLDVDHVAFAQNWKYDGHSYRELTPSEYGQIAGRAGRHVRDGTFGVTGQVAPLPDGLVEQLEGHDFEPVRMLQWRNAKLDFSSVEALRASLDIVPKSPGLTRALPATDQQALEQVIRDETVAALAVGASRVERLWEACALPDYRKIAPAQHAEIVAALYLDLVRRGHVDEDYMAEQVARADRTDGEIDTLSQRVAQIRTWTYVSHRPGWLRDATHWRERTRAIEDRLSDALHERLTQRFVDRRTSVLMKRLRENAMLEASVDQSGQVTVEGHSVGELKGFRFTADKTAEGPDAKAIMAAAQKALGLEFEARAARFALSPNGDISLGSDGKLRWLGQPVGALAASDNWLAPRTLVLVDDLISAPAKEKIQARADRFVAHHIETLLKPLQDLAGAEQLQGTGRGIAYRLAENFGVLARKDVAEDIKQIDKDGRAALRRYGVRFGFYNIFIPALLKPAPAELVTLLWGLKHDGLDRPGYGDVVPMLAAGRTSFAPDAAIDPMFYRLAGFEVLGARVVRIDILERLADLIRPALFWKPEAEPLPDAGYGPGAFFVTPAMMSILGATAADMEAVLAGLGYRSEPVDAAAFEKRRAQLVAEAAARKSAKEDGASKVTVEVRSSRKLEAGDAGVSDDAADIDVAPEATDAKEATEAAPVAGDASANAEGPEAAEVAEAPAPVLVWRQARPERARAPGARPQGAGNKGRARPQDQLGARKDGGRPGRDRPRHDGKGGGKGGKPDAGRAQEKFAKKPARPEKPIDPDSPFAKLAALKEQLKG